MMGSKVLMSLMGYISWYFIANHILQGYVGSIGFALAYIGMMGLFADLGYSTAHIKKVSEGKDLGTCIGTYLTIKVVLLSATVILILLSIWFYQGVYPKEGFESAYDRPVIYILLFWYVLTNLAQIPMNTFMGKQLVAKAELGLLLSTFVQSALTIVLVLHYNDVYALSLTYVAGAIVLFSVSFFLLRGIRIKRPSWSLFMEYTKFGLPLMITVTAAPIVAFIDKIMIKFFWENADVAIYWNAQKFAQLPDELTAVVTNILFPTFSSLIAIGSIGTVKRLTRVAEKYLSLFIIPLTFTLAALSKPFIVIFSDVSYDTSAGVFFFLMGWVTMRALTRPYVAHFVSFNKTSYALFLTLIYVPLNVFFNIIFIPDSFLGIRLLGLGPVGAAIATFISAIINYILTRALSHRLVKIGVNTIVIRYLVAGGISACTLFLFQELLFEITRFYELIGFAALSLLSFIVILVVIKGLTKKDISFIMNTMDIKKMMNYITMELFERDR
ncbi:MAG: oligosaccharide flippase family protein [Candidatus Thermoplasmatota archaeon]|nr:oligosaccharide flippase family protein [Candidatus Thermoplasmatota archaeon]